MGKQFTDNEIDAIREALFYYLHTATTQSHGIAGLTKGDEWYEDMQSAFEKVQ